MQDKKKEDGKKASSKDSKEASVSKHGDQPQ